MPAIPAEWLVGPASALVILLVGYKFLWPVYQQMVKDRIAAADKRGDEWKERALAAEQRADRAEDKVDELTDIISGVVQKAEPK